jgi:hypothetical protein
MEGGPSRFCETPFFPTRRAERRCLRHNMPNSEWDAPGIRLDLGSLAACGGRDASWCDPTCRSCRAVFSPTFSVRRCVPSPECWARSVAAPAMSRIVRPVWPVVTFFEPQAEQRRAVIVARRVVFKAFGPRQPSKRHCTWIQLVRRVCRQRMVAHLRSERV